MEISQFFFLGNFVNLEKFHFFGPIFFVPWHFGQQVTYLWNRVFPKSSQNTSKHRPPGFPYDNMTPTTMTTGMQMGMMCVMNRGHNPRFRTRSLEGWSTLPSHPNGSETRISRNCENRGGGPRGAALPPAACRLPPVPVDFDAAFSAATSAGGRFTSPTPLDRPACRLPSAPVNPGHGCLHPRVPLGEGPLLRSVWGIRPAMRLTASIHLRVQGLAHRALPRLCCRKV